MPPTPSKKRPEESADVDGLHAEDFEQHPALVLLGSRSRKSDEAIGKDNRPTLNAFINLFLFVGGCLLLPYIIITGTQGPKKEAATNAATIVQRTDEPTAEQEPAGFPTPPAAQPPATILPQSTPVAVVISDFRAYPSIIDVSIVAIIAMMAVVSGVILLWTKPPDPPGQSPLSC